jgi:hypothetical protein
MLSFHHPFSGYKNTALQNVPPVKILYAFVTQSTLQREKERSSRLVVGRRLKNPAIPIFIATVNFNPKDGGKSFLRNVGKYLSNCTISQTRRP